jgi:hypothetical protein
MFFHGAQPTYYERSSPHFLLKASPGARRFGDAIAGDAPPTQCRFNSSEHLYFDQPQPRSDYQLKE